LSRLRAFAQTGQSTLHTHTTPRASRLRCLRSPISRTPSRTPVVLFLPRVDRHPSAYPPPALTAPLLPKPVARNLLHRRSEARSAPWPRLRPAAASTPGSLSFRSHSVVERLPSVLVRRD